MDDLYRDGHHYDRLYANDPPPFWPRLIAEHGGPVLELGCGTGRVALTLAEQGYEIAGIDRAPAMLARARKKASERGLAVAFAEADARSLRLGRTFRTIIFPANALCHIHTRSDFEKLARSVRGHLAEGGVFIVDVFVPNPLVLVRDPEGRHPYGSYVHDGVEVNVTCSNRYDHATQINHITTYTQSGRETVAGRLDLKMYYPRELDALLHYNGLPVEHKYGSADLDPFGSDSTRQIVVCRKA